MRSALAQLTIKLEQLTIKQAQTIVMASLDGHTNTEVAATLGVATTTVKTRIRDGFIKLRTALPAMSQPRQAAKLPTSYSPDGSPRSSPVLVTHQFSR